MNFNSFMRVNQIITYAAMSSVIIIAMVMYYLTGTRTYSENDFMLGEIFLIINISVLALSFILSRFLKGKIVDSTKGEDMSKRLNSYRLHLIFSIAFYEMSGFIAGIFMIISGRIEFVIISLASLMLIFMNFPNRMKVKTTLKISDRDLIEGLD